MSSVNEGAKSMRIALIGDLHDYSLAIWPWELLGKTLAGQCNLWLNRRKKFDRSLIKPTIDRVIALKPDLALFSGDLTTTSRPREFRSIAAALAPLLDSCESVIVAGNHDRYTFTAQRTRGIERYFPGRTPETFPFARPLIGGWRLIAVDSAIPRLFDSCGRIGNRQLQHVQSLLGSVREDEGVIVVVHYPFGKPPALPLMKPGHQLLDEHAWRDTLGRCRGRVIVVHGHVHCPWLWMVDGQSMSDRGSVSSRSRMLDVNAGSPTMMSAAWPRGQGFWMLDLPADASQPLTFEHHVQSGSKGVAGDAPVGFDAHAPAQVDRDDERWVSRAQRITLT